MRLSLKHVQYRLSLLKWLIGFTVFESQEQGLFACSRCSGGQSNQSCDAVRWNNLCSILLSQICNVAFTLKYSHRLERNHWHSSLPLLHDNSEQPRSTAGPMDNLYVTKLRVQAIQSLQFHHSITASKFSTVPEAPLYRWECCIDNSNRTLIDNVNCHGWVSEKISVAQVWLIEMRQRMHLTYTPI